MKLRSLLLLIVLAAIWGGSFLFIRMSVGYFGAVPLTASRSLIAACTLVPLVLFKGQWPVFRQYWPHLLVLGLISTALPFSFLSISTQYTSAGFASILNAFTPIFSAIIAWLWIKEYMSVPTVIGIVISFIGLLVMVLDRDTINTSFPLVPILAGMAATFLYGLTGTAYIIYFHLLATIGVTRTVIVTYLSPVFAMLWGFMFLSENVTMKMLIGALCIMLGIGLTTYRPKAFR